MDPILYDLLQQLNQQKLLFKNTHKELLQSSGNNDGTVPSDDLKSLKLDLKQLNNEKAQLIDKLSSMKSKVETESIECKQFDQLLKWTSSLRKHQEEEAELFERGHHQRRELNESSKYIQRIIRKQNDLQSIINSGDDILNALEGKISENQQNLVKMQEEYAENEELLNETLSIMNGAQMNQMDAENLENEVISVNADCQQLEKQRDKLLEAVDSKLGFYKKRAMGVRKKVNAAIERLNESKKEVRCLRTDIIKLDQQMDRMSVNGRRPMREHELKQYMNSLRAKTEKYKKCKIMLQSERNELGILQRTNEILRANDRLLDEYLENKEKENELRTKRSLLQKVSAMKNDFDQQKEAKLSNLAEVVSKINAQLKLKKNKLQPLVKKLKEKRNEFGGFEKAYLEKKAIYEKGRIGYDAELNKLEKQLDSLKKVTNNLESKHKRMRSQIQINKIRLEKVKMEEKYQNGTDVLDQQFKSYRDLYDEEISKLQHLSKSLKSQQMNIRNGHKQNIQQKAYFMQLHEVMQLKLDIVQKRVDQMVELNDQNNENEDRLVLM